jgi:hypothetical protein
VKSYYWEDSKHVQRVCELFHLDPPIALTYSERVGDSARSLVPRILSLSGFRNVAPSDGRFMTFAILPLILRKVLHSMLQPIRGA